MVQTKIHLLALIILLLLVLQQVAEAKDNSESEKKDNSKNEKKDDTKKETKKRGRGTCKIKKYKHCYNEERDCPDDCPYECTLDCPSCEPICSKSSAPSPAPATPPTPSTPTTPTPPTPSTPTTPTPPTPSTPTTPTPPTPSTPTTPTPPTPSTPTTPTPPTPSTPTTPTPPTPSTPSPPTPTSAPPPDQSEAAGRRRARCRNRSYPQCYNSKHVCPTACPGGCEVDCATCKPVCKCDQPGAVCQDPRFIGGDGLTFYFHGKKDRDFCLLSDRSLHINAHFIGKRNPDMRRDFTWVQSIGILFGTHKLFLGALKTAAWDDSIDRLTISFDGEPITLPETEGAKWQPESVPGVFAVRTADANAVVVEAKGSFRITAKVVPITKEDSRIHNYGVTDEDSLAHLDLRFKFFSLSDRVSGVLGQTYRPNYASRVNVAAKMPVMGGDREFRASSLFATDCAVATFEGTEYVGAESSGLPSLSCTSGLDGRGVVCKK